MSTGNGPETGGWGEVICRLRPLRWNQGPAPRRQVLASGHDRPLLRFPVPLRLARCRDGARPAWVRRDVSPASLLAGPGQPPGQQRPGHERERRGAVVADRPAAGRRGGQRLHEVPAPQPERVSGRPRRVPSGRGKKAGPLPSPCSACTTRTVANWTKLPFRTPPSTRGWTSPGGRRTARTKRPCAANCVRIWKRRRRSACSAPRPSCSAVGTRPISNSRS